MPLFSHFRKAPSPAVPEQPPPNVTAKAQVSGAADPASFAAQEEQTLRAALAAADTPTLARLVVEGASTRIRQAAAEAIDDPVQVRQLIRNTRGGNDKKVYKILARKRDALLAREREVEQLQAEITAAAAALERHSQRSYDPLFTPTLQQLENRWQAVAAHAAPDIAQQVQQAIDRSREVIAQHLRQIASKAASELAAANASVEARRQREQEEQAAAAAAAEQARSLEEKRKAQAEQLEAEAQALRQIGGLVRKAHAALAAGSSRTAAGLRRAIEEKLSAAAPLPGQLANQLRQLDAKLEDLKDWKSFSVAPKRVQLIERMESLVGATLHPAALAGQIKGLQEQWRTLSRGAAEDVEADWQRFHEAGQKAYQPCAAFFEAQAQVKQENLRQRGVLLERLAAFEAQHDWQQPDWRTVLTALREARQLWRQHSPVEPGEVERLQGRFNELTAALQSRVDAQNTRNEQEKKSLIERARGLLAATDSRRAIDEVKRLQEKWQSVGPLPRDQERKLWEQFRQQCDALFQRRQQEFASQAEALQANRARAASLCEELEKIATLADQELLESAPKLADLQRDFDAIGELPKGNARQLQERFERAFERCRQAVARQHARDAEQGWSDVLDAANYVRAYRLALVGHAAAAELDTLKQTAEDHLAGAARWPRRALEALRHAFAQQGGSDPAANELALRKLCIRAEVLTDAPTPAADLPLRREYQVQRLRESMGQGIRAEEGQLDTLALEWLGMGPTEEAAYLQLLERFKECRRRGLPASGHKR